MKYWINFYQTKKYEGIHKEIITKWNVLNWQTGKFQGRNKMNLKKETLKFISDYQLVKYPGFIFEE